MTIWRPLLWACLCQLVFSAAGAELVINEFLADPAGSDSGHEFVELFNPGPAAVNLDGVSLEFGNGAVGPDWAVRWQCQEDIHLPPGGFFLLVDRNWQGQEAFQVMVYLGLQNGPDALRICRQDMVLDLVGYGALTDPQMMESAAVALPSGLSLSRKPDGHDTQNNQLDFHATEPTAGGSNFEDLKIEISLVQAEPPSLPQANDPVQLIVNLENAGLLDFPAGPLLVVSADVDSVETVLLQTHFSGLVQGESGEIQFNLNLPQSGRQDLSLDFWVAADHPHKRYELITLQVGPAELRLNEVLPAPDANQGEWIELMALEAIADLSTFAISDEEGPKRFLPSQDLFSGELCLVAQDSVALHLTATRLRSEERRCATQRRA